MTFIQIVNYSKLTRIFEIFKSIEKIANNLEVNVGDEAFPPSNIDIQISENPHKKSRKLEINEIDSCLMKHDPKLRPQIWDYHVNQRD